MRLRENRNHEPVEGNLRQAYRAPPRGAEPSELAWLLGRLREALECADGNRPGDKAECGH